MREDEILKACGAEVLKQGNNLVRYSFSTDTRSIKKGDVYLPLKGVSFDGENFIEDALLKGASGYFTTKDVVHESAEVVFKVSDTLDAYLALAQAYKNRINPKVIGVTGSSGKTTTKEMIYSVVSQKYNTVKTFSNHNNEIGFCQTMFEMSADTEVVIVEMGMRGLGEIELISRYAEPDYAIVTNAGSAHIGRLGSLENRAKAKCEIANFLNPNGAFISLDQQRIKDVLNYSGEKIYYSLEQVEILEKKPSYSKFIYKGNEYELNIEGDYNIENSLSAIEVGYKLGMQYEDIKRGLALYKPIEKRWEVETAGELKIINDSYNANPESMKASVKTFVELYKNPVVVLGNMGELGADEVLYHQEVGTFLSTLNVKNVKFLTVGNLAEEIGKKLAMQDVEVHSFENNSQVVCYILDNLNVGYTIFLKASRSMKFEEIVESLKRGKI